MAEVKEYYPGDLAGALDLAMTWMLSRMNANVSPFAGNAVTTPTDPEFAEGTVNCVDGTFAGLAQEPWPNIVFDPVAGVAPDDQSGPDGFPINYASVPLPSGNLLVHVLPLVTNTDVSGRVFNLLQVASAYRVDVYSHTDVFYYQGSSTIAADNTWRVAAVASGTAIAFLMPASSPQPAPGSWRSVVTDWIAHSNTGLGNKLKDYFVRLYSKTDIEYLQEDNIPILVQDSLHARFGASQVAGSGTLVAHVIHNDPTLGQVDVYSTLQNEAVYSDLPRSLEVHPSDPSYVPSGALTISNVAAIQNRSWIYSASLAIIAFAVAGLWGLAKRIIVRLNTLREDPGYLPSLNLETAEDGLAARWSLVEGAGNLANLFDPTEPPNGSDVIAFIASTAPATWNFVGAGLPDPTASIIAWRYKSGIAHRFIVGVSSSTGKVTSVEFAPSGTPGYDPVEKKVTVALPWAADRWRGVNQNIDNLISRYVPGESLASIVSFRAQLDVAGELRLDNLSVGAPQPPGSLSFSYDVYNGQVDQAYIRNGAVAWICYAYAIYMERTGDFQSTALGLQSMLNYLFTQQSADPSPRQNLIMLGYGRYQNPGYQYEPGQETSVSTEHNIDSYFAFDKAARVLPTAAQNLYQRGFISQAQRDSLSTTANICLTKAAQIRAAILGQLWIPPSGNTKGHFAQGASASGLDTSLALDAAGSWAALFCHDVGEDMKAVECLKFIYETFLVTNQQVLRSSDADTFNQAYEQLTPFDGFKPYADSSGGYSNSPNSVWQEGTWGALAAYLRLADNANLQTYFNANYAGGLPAFLARHVQSQKIVATTTGGNGLLDYSLAARSLPWEFGVQKALAATSWFWLTATHNDVLFNTQAQPPQGHPLLKIPSGVQQTVDQLEGRGSIGALRLEATDGGGYMTALVCGGKLEGRRVTLKVGYPGMASSDFVTLATQGIESVAALPDLTGYVLECRDLKRSAKTKIFTHGDDGYPVSNDHPRTLTANPMDVALLVFQNELGLGQVPSNPESAWKLYDPGRWDLAAMQNPTLIWPNASLDVEQFLFYRHGIFSGYLFEFTFRQSVEAKQFLEYEIFRPLGGYLIVLADGRLSPRFFLPPSSCSNLFALHDRNITVLPGLERQPIINQVTYRMDYDGNKFQTELLFLDAPSLQQFGLAGQHTIESKGMTVARGGASLAGLTATRIFRRYAGIDPVAGGPVGGTPTLSVTSHFMTLTVEVGDFVFLSHALLPNIETGRRGVFNRICEVIEKQPNYSEGTMTYRLLDVAWVNSKRLSRIPPQGTPPYSSASTAERARYTFVSSEQTKEYSDGTSGKTIF